MKSRGVSPVFFVEKDGKTIEKRTNIGLFECQKVLELLEACGLQAHFEMQEEKDGNS